MRIEAYNKELSKEDFESNFLVQDAVLRNIILIGEAAKNIPEDFKQNVLQRDLPQLKLTFSKLLNQ